MRVQAQPRRFPRAVGAQCAQCHEQKAVMYRSLIEVSELAGLLAQGAASADLALMDCRFELTRPRAGAAAFAESHLPGAQYADLEADLCGPVTPTSGRHPLPEPGALAQRLGAWGIDASVQVVAYDQGSGAYAARLWWLMRWLGAERVAVLSGGYAAWTAARQGVTAARDVRTARHFNPRPQPQAALTSEEVARGLASGSIRLVDARAPDRFAGQNETIDPVAGHVPGAVNHPFSSNLGADGRFLPAGVLRERWLATLAGRAPQALVAMCGSGVTACHNLLALELAELPGARLFAGSWSEWIRDPSRPIASGAW
jgi:thiosulfate/3-mercaptopyruvate sulfurtransferase